jgi:hypothetical protein
MNFGKQAKISVFERFFEVYKNGHKTCASKTLLGTFKSLLQTVWFVKCTVLKSIAVLTFFEI